MSHAARSALLSNATSCHNILPCNAPRSRSPSTRWSSTPCTRDIESGRLPAGGRVPSEADLVDRFGASRITVGRAVRDLQLQGLVERRDRVGHLRPAPAPTAAAECTFGVLVPDLPDIEIFEPLVQGLLSAAEARPHAFLWGGGDAPGIGRAGVAWTRVQQYIARRVDGVFFAPLEGLSAGDATNVRIVDGARRGAGFPSYCSIARCTRIRSAVRTTSSASTTGASASPSPSTCSRPEHGGSRSSARRVACRRSTGVERATARRSTCSGPITRSCTSPCRRRPTGRAVGLSRDLRAGRRSSVRTIGAPRS